MKVLGLDPATKCGWAILEDGKRIDSGVWNMAITSDQGDGVRVLRMRDNLLALLGDVDLVAYEMSAARFAGAALVYGSLVGMIMATCEEHGVGYVPVHWATVKRIATGKGNAKKAAMVAAANERFAPHVVQDDNEADALWVAVAALEAA